MKKEDRLVHLELMNEINCQICTFCKYSEYESARREYSKDLVDGDLFYKVIKLNEYWRGIESNIFSYYNGNSIRLLSDVIAKVTFIPSVTSGTPSIYVKFNRECPEEYLKNDKYFAEFKLEYSGERDRLFIGENGGAGIFHFYTFSGGWQPATNVPDTFISRISNDLKKYIGLKENFKLETLPDEYFEIRKIVRETTDF